MPPTVEVVERATGLLKEAAAGFDIDPKCKESMGKLLEGSRGAWREEGRWHPYIRVAVSCVCAGILNGMSQLLLVLDQSEVRKIIKNCNGVREYIKVAEHVESLEEQATFAKNLSPGLTTTTRQVCSVPYVGTHCLAACDSHLGRSFGGGLGATSSCPLFCLIPPPSTSPSCRCSSVQKT